LELSCLAPPKTEPDILYFSTKVVRFLDGSEAFPLKDGSIDTSIDQGETALLHFKCVPKIAKGI